MGGKKKSSSIAIELTAVCAGLFCEKRRTRGKVLRYLFGQWELGAWRLGDKVFREDWRVKAEQFALFVAWWAHN